MFSWYTLNHFANEVDRMKFIEVDIAGKITIKSKLCEITFPDITFMCPLVTRSKLKVHKRTM